MFNLKTIQPAIMAITLLAAMTFVTPHTSADAMSILTIEELGLYYIQDEAVDSPHGYMEDNAPPVISNIAIQTYFLLNTSVCN